MATISALLYYGGYMSQYDMRLFSNSNTKIASQTNSEYLLGVNDAYCAGQVKLSATQWSRKSNNVQDFLVWVKTNIKAGYPVTIGVYTNQYLFYGSKISTAGDSDYDHIVPVLAITSKYNDALYHADDIITFSDNGESACIGATKQATCDDDRQTRPYYYNYTFSSFVATRTVANSKTSGHVYSLPSSTSVGNYGIAHTGIVDPTSQTLPITITTNVNNETPDIVDGSSTRPAASNIILTIVISKLTPNVKYNLYKYSSAAKVPTSKFNANAKNAATVTSITGPTNGVYSFSVTIQSNQQVFYRCVPANGA